MKIDPTDKLQAVIKPAPVNQKVETGHGDFASVFEQKVARPEPPFQSTVQSVSPLTPPSLQMMTGPTNNEKTTAGLLDRLEMYRQLLADRTATLRDLESVVEHMKQQSDDAQKILNTIPKGDPVKAVLQETVLVVTKEVERFNLGFYVEG